MKLSPLWGGVGNREKVRVWGKGRPLRASKLLETQPLVAFKAVTTEIYFDINSPHLKAWSFKR